MARFISSASIRQKLTIEIDSIPNRGEIGKAKITETTASRGFISMRVVTRFGVETIMASPLGSGPNSYAVRRQLDDLGIEPHTDIMVGDIGISISIKEKEGYTRTIMNPGVEVEPTFAGLRKIRLEKGDLVYVSGIDLTNNYGAKNIITWIRSIPDNITVVFDVSPGVRNVDASRLIQILPRVDILTLNTMELGIVNRLLTTKRYNTSLLELLPQKSFIVKRTGIRGCEVTNCYSKTVRVILPYATRRKDVTPLGDFHLAVMCAYLLKGYDIYHACNRANAACALYIASGGDEEVINEESVLATVKSGKVALPSRES